MLKYIFLAWAGITAVTAATNETASFEIYYPSGFGTPPKLPGSYKGLYWEGFKQGPYSYAAGSPIGIAPHSFPNAAAFGCGFTDGADYPATMTVSDGLVTNASFQLFDFYYGCQAQYNFTYPTGSQVTLYPQNCTLNVTGYRSDVVTSPPDVSTTFEFVPNYHLNSRVGVNYSTMAHAVLPESFKGMRVVTLNATSTAATALSAPAVYVDDLSYATEGQAGG